ncbi:mucin-2 [Cololabis saira]|uniref:mucin-2 n=1 Tax=Cololabis saira TaxID=129043 RepID=UPI002AD522D7|nr:mucin-2 [Cololabis saira]
MSVSDAGGPARAGGGETEETPLCARAPPTRTAAAARENQDERIGGGFRHKNHRGDKTPAEQHRSAVRQEETHKALPVKQAEASRWDHSDVHIRTSVRSSFTPHRFFRVSNPELRLKNSSGLWSHQQISLNEPQLVETKDRVFEVNGRAASSSGTSIETAGVCPSPVTTPFPAKREKECFTAVCHKPEITRHLSKVQILSNRNFGSTNDLHIPPRGSQTRTCFGSLTGTEKEKAIKDHTKDHTKLYNRVQLGKQPDDSLTMLSSTMVTVLAPHWSGRLRRTKRVEETGNSEARGNFQDAAITLSNHEKGFQETLNQHRVENVLTDGLHFPRRVPFLGTRRNTVGWSAKSDPLSLDFKSKREMTQAVSLDSGAMRPPPTSPSSRSPDFRASHEQKRNPQTGQQGGPSSINSKPTSGSLLLSLRVNSSGRNLNTPSTFPNTNPSHQSSLPNTKDRNLLTTHHSQIFLNNNEQQRPKPLLSPSSISYRSTETGPVISPSSYSYRERKVPDTFFFSTSPINKDAEDNLFSKQLQKINRDQPSLAASKQTFQSEGPSGKQHSLDISTKPFTENSTSRHSPYDHSTVLKTHSLPRRTTLTSTSWWKQVSQEGSPSPALNNKANINGKPKMAVVAPFNRMSDKVSPSLKENKRPGSQNHLDIDNNNRAESTCNLNFALTTQSTESKSLDKQHYRSNLNNREPQKPQSMPDVLSSSKISRAPTQITLCFHTKDPSKHNVNNASFAANTNEIQPTSKNPKSSNLPPNINSKHRNYCPPKTNNTPTFPHNMDTFTKPSLSLDFPTTLNSQATSQTISGLPAAPSSSSFVSQPVYPKTNAHASSSQTAKLANQNKTTPIGFERSYTGIPKPFYPKAMSSLNPTVHSVSKNNFSPVCTSSTKSYTTLSPSLLSPSITPTITSPITTTSSFLLTPPETPVIISPNSETSSPMREGTFAGNPEREPKKLHPEVEGKKRLRQVKWEDSVEVHCVDPVTVRKADTPPVQMKPLSPSRFPPSIFSLRSSSPERGTSPVCFPNSKDFSRQVGKEGKYRSFSSDSADLAIKEREKSKHRTGDTNIFDQGRQDSSIPKQGRTLSVESGTVQCHSSAPLSLPPDFSSSYKLRYSSPPYSTLKSTRPTKEELITKPQRSPLFPQTSQSNDIPKPSLNKDPLPPMTTSSPPLHPWLSPSRSSTFQKKTPMQGSPRTDQVNHNHNEYSTQTHANTQVQLLDNRVHIRSQSLPGDKAHSSSATYVTETLVYSIKPKVDEAAPVQKSNTPKSVQHNANTLVAMETRSNSQSHTQQSKEVGTQSSSQSNQSSNGCSRADGRSCDYESRNRSVTQSMPGKSRFYSVEVNNELSPKKNRFALKRSSSTPNSNLSRSHSDRVSKSYNKVDQVFNKLRQKFSSRRSDDDSSFSWKWKRAPQAPSISGSSDTSSVSDVSVDSTKMLEERVQETGMVLKDNADKTEAANRITQNRYTLTPASTNRDAKGGYEFSIWSEQSPPDSDRDEQQACAEDTSDGKVHLMVHGPANSHFDLYENNGTDYKASNQFFSCTDPNADRSPTAAYPSQGWKSTPSPRSPFSPFSSLSPVSPFPSPDTTDDNVFYSPKLQRRRESPSSCETEGDCFGVSRRIRVSTGPPSASPGQDKGHLASSYADLKYGIEPSRSFSVSSVLSSRPSGPGRISTGSRFMSVGDLSWPALSCGGGSRDLDQWSFKPDWSEELVGQPRDDCEMSDLLNDPSNMRSRSLPRSLTRCLANWSSGIPISETATTTSKPARLCSPHVDSCHFAWDTEGLPTPPPTPPLSPVSRSMSKPPNLPSAFPSSSGTREQVDNQSSRGLLPSRGYVSSLSTFDESSDSSSDTTTDDEYYLDDEDGEKETEL